MVGNKRSNVQPGSRPFSAAWEAGSTPSYRAPSLWAAGKVRALAYGAVGRWSPHDASGCRLTLTQCALKIARARCARRGKRSGSTAGRNSYQSATCCVPSLAGKFARTGLLNPHGTPVGRKLAILTFLMRKTGPEVKYLPKATEIESDRSPAYGAMQEMSA